MDAPADDARAATSEVAISVVVPNYNHGHVLAECIDAILGQHLQADEVVIVDDGSTDNSREIIAAIAAREPRVVVVMNAHNLGAVASMNRGLAACRGRFVAFAAADDLLAPEFLALASASLAGHPQAALFCAEVITETADAEGNLRRTLRPTVRPCQQPGYIPPARVRALLGAIDFFIVTQSAVFRRDLLVAAGGFDAELGSLADGFLAGSLALAHGFCFAPQVVATWRIDRGGLSRAAAGNVARVRELLDLAAHRIGASPVHPPGYAALFDGRLRVATCRIALTEPEPNWPFVAAIGARNGLDHAVLAAGRALPPRFGTRLALFWLLLRYRPLAAGAVLATKVRRWRAGGPGAMTPVARA